MDLVDQTLGQFQIVEQVGKGGMATVYKAYQPSLQRFVAIKVLSPKLADDLDLVKRFVREAQSAAKLQHANVIIIHEAASEGETHYIVTEFLEGMTLAQLLQEEGALEPQRILNIARQIANALDYAHSRGFIHRDIKPSNIMIDPSRNDHVTLMDFGLVQVAGGSRITRTGFIMGTPDYMSPEQAKGDPIDRRTDIYSLGVTIYHMLTGEVPFSKSTPHAVLLAHIMEDPPSMAATDRNIPSEVEAVVRKAMNKDPNDRYEWAGDMVADMETAITSPALFTAPPIRPSMYPQASPTAAPPGPPQYGQTPPRGVTGYPQTPYPQTPPGGITPYPQAQPSRPRWVWPVVGLVSFAVMAGLVIAGILLWPQISALLAGTPVPTQAASLPSPTPAPTQVDAPLIEVLEVTPGEAVRGTKAELSWKVSGTTTRVEVSANFQTTAVPAEGKMPVEADDTTVFVLNACNESRCVTQSVTLNVIDPTATSTATHTPQPTDTETPVPTDTPLPPTPSNTPTATPPPTTPTPTVAQPPTATKPAQPAATATPKPSAGVIHTFEQFGTWKRGTQPYGEFTQSQEQVKAGNYAGKLAYNFAGSTASDDFVVFANQVGVSGEPNAISAWVYGDQSGHFFNVWIQDAEGQVWSVHLGAIVFSGWQQLAGAIDPAREWPSGKVYGPDNGKIDYPIRFYGIVLDRPASGPLAGAIHVDDISIGTVQVTTEPGTTSTPGAVVPVSGQIGRIIFTVKVEEKRYSLYSTDPTWNKAVQIGETDWGHSTCPEENSAATSLDGTTVSIRPVWRCQIAGTVGSCPSPDARFKVNTNNYGTGFSVVLFNVAENRIQESYYEGKLNIYVGLNWAPDSSHFLFTVDSSVYRADVGKPGIYQVIPYKDPEWPLQYSADGSWVMYLKPVSGAISDVFVASPSGTGERNVTNAPISVKLCPRWRQ